MLRLPAPKGKNREILFIYGHHSSIERWQGLARVLNRYGAVTMPDLPGFGGMDSLYKIGEPATINNLADYLASFIKLKYRSKKVTIVGLSFGFAVVTRMLQRCPELSSKVENLVSVVGFSHYEDFKIQKSSLRAFKGISQIFSRKLPAVIFREVALRPFILRNVYQHGAYSKEKFKDAINTSEFKTTMEGEVKLWRINDVQTHFKTYLEMFSLDNTHTCIDLPVFHISVKNDRYFNIVNVEQHLHRIFSEVHTYESPAPNHAPTIVSDEKEAAKFIPDQLRRRVFYKPRTKN